MGRHKNHKSAIAAAGTWTSSSLLMLLLYGCFQVQVACREVQAPQELLEDKIEGPGSFDVTEGYNYNVAVTAFIRINGLLTPAKYCTGTLVAPKRVLTAADCCWNSIQANGISQDGQWYESVTTLIGGHALGADVHAIASGSSPLPRGVDLIDVFYKLLTMPSGWSDRVRLGGHRAREDDLYNHMCLLFLARESVMQPAKVVVVDYQHWIRYTLTHAHAFTYGWGSQNTSQPMTYRPITNLKGLLVEAVPCRPHPRLPMLSTTWRDGGDGAPYDVPRFFCHYPSVNASSSSCFGDEGGPLLVDDKVWGVHTITIHSPDGQDRCQAPNVEVSVYVNVWALEWQRFFRDEGVGPYRPIPKSRAETSEEAKKGKKKRSTG